jgi:hypothetical protein
MYNSTKWGNLNGGMQNKGEKVHERQPQLSNNLKFSIETFFFDNKSPQKRCVVFLPPTVFGKFFERGVFARCARGIF